MIATQTIKMIDTFLAEQWNIFLLEQEYVNFLNQIKLKLSNPNSATPTDVFYLQLINEIKDEIKKNGSITYFYLPFLTQLKKSLESILEKHRIHNYSSDGFLKYRANRFYSKLDQYIDDAQRHKGEVVVPFSQSLYPEIIKGICLAYIYATGESFLENPGLYKKRIGQIPHQTFTPKELLRNNLNHYNYKLLPELLPIRKKHYRYASTNTQVDNPDIHISIEFDSLTDTSPFEYFNHSAQKIIDNIIALFETEPGLSILVLNYRTPLKITGHSVGFIRDQKNNFYFIEPTFCTLRFKNKNDLKNWFIQCYPNYSERLQFEYFIQSMSFQKPDLFSQFINVGRKAARISTNVMNYFIERSLHFFEFETENPKEKIHQEYLSEQKRNRLLNNIQPSKQYCIDDLEFRDIQKTTPLKQKKYSKDDSNLDYKALKNLSFFRHNPNDFVINIAPLENQNVTTTLKN